MPWYAKMVKEPNLVDLANSPFKYILGNVYRVSKPAEANMIRIYPIIGDIPRLMTRTQCREFFAKPIWKNKPIVDETDYIT